MGMDVKDGKDKGDKDGKDKGDKDGKDKGDKKDKGGKDKDDKGDKDDDLPFCDELDGEDRRRTKVRGLSRKFSPPISPNLRIKRNLAKLTPQYLATDCSLSRDA